MGLEDLRGRSGAGGGLLLPTYAITFGSRYRVPRVARTIDAAHGT